MPRISRSDVLKKFRAMIRRGEPIIGGGAGTGLSAKCEEAGGIDLIVIYNSGRYRMAGRGSLAGLMAYGNADATLNATTAATSGPLSLTKSIALQQDTMGFGDLYPMFAERWNAGVNNYMAYLTGDIPVGRYSSTNLANIGIGHGALDGGLGYTYFDPKAGHEFSAVAGLTGNFENTSTDYTNGIDFHLDWAASQFLTKQFLIGAVGYFYRGIGCDTGSGDQVGCFHSQVVGVGPQLGFIIPLSTTTQGYLNFKSYW